MTNVSLGICGLLLSALLQVGSAAVIELTTNGGFESGDFTGWTQFPAGPGQQTVTNVNPSEGNFAGEISNDVSFSASLLRQANIGIGVVSPGELITISFDARGSFATGGVAFAEFFSELAGGGTSSSAILGGAPLALNSDPDVWTSFLFTTTAGPDVSGGVTLQLSATNGPGNPTTIFYDNVSVSVVPEPTTTLFALMGIYALGIRRCRR